MVENNPAASSYCSTFRTIKDVERGETEPDLRLGEVPFCYTKMSDAESVVGVDIGPVKNEVLNLLGRIGCSGECETCPVFEAAEMGKRVTDTLVGAIVANVDWMGRMATRIREITGSVIEDLT